MGYSSLPGRESVDEVDRSKLIISNNISCLKLAEYLGRHMCLQEADDEGTTASAASLDAFISVTSSLYVTSVAWSLVTNEKGRKQSTKMLFQSIFHPLCSKVFQESAVIFLVEQ